MHLSEIWHSKKNDCRLSRTQVNNSVMRERVHVNRTMKDLVADLRLMKSVLLSQYMPFLFAQRQEIGFPSRTEIDVPSPKTTQQ